MILVRKKELKIDRNGKRYHLLSLFSPEEKVKVKNSSGKMVTLLGRSKRCGYVAYENDYTDIDKGDFGSDLNEGDEVHGTIVKKQVEPYWAGNELLTTCTVPVFGLYGDPIEFEIAMEKAIKNAGKILAVGQLEYGDEPPEVKQKQSIPDMCLVVKQLD